MTLAFHTVCTNWKVREDYLRKLSIRVIMRHVRLHLLPGVLMEADCRHIPLHPCTPWPAHPRIGLVPRAISILGLY